MKIKYLPLQPHCFAFGGFELQMLSAFNAIKKKGVNVEKLDIWDRNQDFDILHCWGLGFSNYENFIWAKKTNKKLIATVLVYYYDSIYKKLKFHISSKIHTQKIFIQMLSLVDALVVVNEEQARVCNTLYKVPRNKIFVIPNIVTSNYFDASIETSIIDQKSYLLTTGNVCERKNQVLLAEACAEKNLDLVIIGKPLDGEAEYAEKLENITNKNKCINWIKGLKENSNELINYYKNCSAFVLPSFVEQQPISVLEASILHKPILIADKDYAKQKYFENACLINPSSKKSLIDGLMKIKNNPELYIPKYVYLSECKEENVSDAYIKVYNS
jgi:glycosyltransferase involved in cell wall biosynthesis